MEVHRLEQYMSKYQSFRNHTELEARENSRNIAEFISKHLSKAEVVLNDTTNLEVVLTRTHKEGLDETILFSYKNSGVKVGDIITHEEIDYLVFMEYLHPLKDYYKKHQLIETNITVGVDSLFQKGAYIGSLRSFIDKSSSSKEKISFLYETTKPVIITKDNGLLKINTRFLAANEAFRVVALDRVTNKGIIYMSVEGVPKLHSDELTGDTVRAITPPKAEKSIPSLSFLSGKEYTIPILDGFVNFSPSVKILSRTKDSVKFIAPTDVKKIIITVKNLDSDFVTATYEVI